jgi:hypothetical protein
MKREANRKPHLFRQNHVKFGLCLLLVSTTWIPAFASPKVQQIASASSGHSTMKTAPHVDSFNVNTPVSPDDVNANHSRPNTSSELLEGLSPVSERTPIVIWFEGFDDARAKHRPTDEDKIILARPINQDSKRLAQWIAAASRVAQVYSSFASTLRKTSIPKGYADVREYCDLTADWYSDVAQTYADMIRPRHPAKTIEELQDSLKEIHGRQTSLVSTLSSLQSMDRSLRERYRVHQSAEDDVIQKFILNK